MDNTKILENLGLNDNEAKIYLALLRLGGLKASQLAKEAGLKRTTVYPILQSMTQSGFVNVYYRSSQKTYFAEKPAKLATVMQNKLDIFQNIIPVLETMEKKDAKKIGLRFIESLSELKEFYLGILNEYQNKSYKIIGDAGAWEGLDNDWFIQYRKDRAKHNIKTRLLLTDKSKNINPTDTSLLRQFKYVPTKHEFKTTLDIFNDKILIVSPSLSSLAVVIEAPIMVDVFKSVFEIIWDMLPISE